MSIDINPSISDHVVHRLSDYNDSQEAQSPPPLRFTMTVVGHATETAREKAKWPQILGGNGFGGAMGRVRMLQISDLHERAARETEPWRRRRVLGDVLGSASHGSLHPDVKRMLRGKSVLIALSATRSRFAGYSSGIAERKSRHSLSGAMARSRTPRRISFTSTAANPSCSPPRATLPLP